MNNNKLMQQVTAIFGIFMVFFYLGAGIYLIFFFKNTTLDRAVIVIFGSVMIFYGIFRAYRSYVSIVNLFFRRRFDDEEEM
jgi:cytochrome c biogenesis protein CcdA